MTGKSPISFVSAGKKPTSLKKLRDRAKNEPDCYREHTRPRRFSLIYLNDNSSLSDLSDIDEKKLSMKFKNPKFSRKLKGISNNAMGKQSKLIRESEIEFTSNSESDISSDSESSSDNDDINNSSSSDDEVDFVRLTVEKKKRAMKALNALKRGKTPKKSNFSTVSLMKSLDKQSESEGSDGEALAFNFKENDGIQFGNVKDEDLGEEIADKIEKKSSKRIVGPTLSTNNVDSLNIPQISESEETEYEIDQDAYFKTIEDDDNVTGVDTCPETGDEDMAVLDAEEQNMVLELQNDGDSLSNFKDENIYNSIKLDPVIKNNIEGSVCEDEYDDYGDQIMGDLNIPFDDDSKFASLYYHDSNDHILSLSTSLPPVLSEEKRKEQGKSSFEKWKHEKRIKKQKKKNKVHSVISDFSDDYIFGLFFHSDDENPPNLQLESSLHNLNTTMISDSEISSDEYENILLDVAHIPTESDDSINASDEGHESDDYDDSISDVFLDIDDLDPDSFYFKYNSSGDINDTNDISKEKYTNESDNYMETVIYVDNESTDDDETIPPPNLRNRKIGSKAKEVVSANVVGLRPPKLGTWETDNKPFSIIDGLSTKSLYPLIQEHQQLLEFQQQQQQQQQQPILSTTDLGSVAEKEELTLNELLNMSELDDNDTGLQPNISADNIANWYDTHKVPLSAFRNKGVTIHQDEDFMLPFFSSRKFPIGYIGSERTRRTINKLKEIKKRKDQKRRKLKKRKKMLKLKREKQRLEKEAALASETISTDKTDNLLRNRERLDSNINQVVKNDDDDSGSLILPTKSKHDGTNLNHINHFSDKSHDELVVSSTHDSDLVDGATDAEILASLTAPIDLTRFDDSISSKAAWRRRHSMTEAAAENLRVTKSGLFSELALADIDDIIGNVNTVEFMEAL